MHKNKNDDIYISVGRCLYSYLDDMFQYVWPLGIYKLVIILDYVY